MNPKYDKRFIENQWRDRAKKREEEKLAAKPKLLTPSEEAAELLEADPILELRLGNAGVIHRNAQKKTT